VVAVTGRLHTRRSSEIQKPLRVQQRPHATGSSSVRLPSLVTKLEHLDTVERTANAADACILDSGLRAMAQITEMPTYLRPLTQACYSHCPIKRDDNQPRSTPFCAIPKRHLISHPFSDSGACNTSPEDNSDDTKRPRGQGQTPQRETATGACVGV
jgi:hypothetical protein